MLRGPARLLLLGVVLSGCESSTSEVSSRTPAPAEPSWEEQIAAVRSHTSTEIRVESSAITAEQWSQLAEGCSHIAVVEVSRFAQPGPDLSILGRLPQLRRLKLDLAADDDDLRQMAAIPSLQVLNLPQAEFTNDGLASLMALPQLQLLRFSSPRVTDDGLRHIAAMPALRFLHLIDVPITDAGLPHLYDMHQLESFYLDGGSCTDEGLSELLRALPELHFHRDQLHLPGDPHSHPH